MRKPALCWVICWVSLIVAILSPLWVPMINFRSLDPPERLPTQKRASAVPTGPCLQRNLILVVPLYKKLNA